MHVTMRIPVHQVWRAKLPNLDASASEQSRRVVANGSFAICACDVYGFPRELNILQ